MQSRRFKIPADLTETKSVRCHVDVARCVMAKTCRHLIHQESEEISDLPTRQCGIQIAMSCEIKNNEHVPIDLQELDLHPHVMCVSHVDSLWNRTNVDAN